MSVPLIKRPDNCSICDKRSESITFYTTFLCPNYLKFLRLNTNRNKMTVSTILLRCHNCEEEMGSFDIDYISLVSAQALQFLVTKRIHITCDNCQDCQHEFGD